MVTIIIIIIIVIIITKEEEEYIPLGLKMDESYRRILTRDGWCYWRSITFVSIICYINICRCEKRIWHENVEKIELLAIFSSMNFRDHRVIERCLRTRRRKRGTRSAVGENVGASGYRSPASSVVIDPCSPCLSLSLTLSLLGIAIF